MQAKTKGSARMCLCLDQSCMQAEDKEHDPLAQGMLAWASPLQHDWSATSAPRQVSIAPGNSDSSAGGYAAMGGAATAAAGLVAAATAVAAAAQPPPASALSLAMRLVEGSQAAGITGEEGVVGWCARRGPSQTVAASRSALVELSAGGLYRGRAFLPNAFESLLPPAFRQPAPGTRRLLFLRPTTDVTRRASQLLLAHRGLLTPPQLARLAAKMAEVGMTPELRDLVAYSSASGSHAGQAVGFVAAALTGEWQCCCCEMW
jgi:hypothetical protein